MTITSNTVGHDSDEGRVIDSTTVLERKGWGLFARKRRTVSTSRMVIQVPAGAAVLPPPPSQLAACPSCGVRNRLPLDHRNYVECGACKNVMQIIGSTPVVDGGIAAPPAPMAVCPSCGVKNRLPEEHKNRVRCGKCKAEMRVVPNSV